jgi:hypothetical protein
MARGCLPLAGRAQAQFLGRGGMFFGGGERVFFERERAGARVWFFAHAWTVPRRSA